LRNHPKTHQNLTIAQAVVTQLRQKTAINHSQRSCK